MNLHLAILVALIGLAGAAHAQTETTVTVVNPSSEVCPVTKPDPAVPSTASHDYLALNFDFSGSDQGISVDDPLHKVTWLFTGDALAADAVAWFGVFGANAGGANMIGYLNGADYGNPASLCNHLQFVTVPGMKSNSGGAVFSPDVVTAPPGDSISNYIFVPVPNAKNAPDPIIPSNSGIPGIDETVTGAFLEPNENGSPETIYLFYAGSPGDQVNSDGSLGFPVTSVSYLAAWKNPSSSGTANGIAPTNYQVLARVDYSLDNTDTTSCPSKFPTLCPPLTPAGWQSTAPVPPLAGHFVWVSTEPGPDGYLYLFGTGKFRASQIYLARFPAARVSTIGQCSSPPCYLSATPGFQIWTSSLPSGSPRSPGWSSNPPSAAEIQGASPLSFPDDTTADAGQISVRFFSSLGFRGLWLMMETPNGNPKFDQKVIARWADSPAGPWSAALVVFDMTTATGSQNQKLYCCQGQWNGNLDAAGRKVWECLGPKDGVPVQQCMECNDAGAGQSSGSVGALRFDFYSPFMLPYLANVSKAFSFQSGTGYVEDTFTVSYMLSVFEPYNSVLMNYTLQVASPAVPDRFRR
ncbi:MAG: hypothetical protein ABSG41_10185 [Bryobacteraceae bacterium]